jgi:hypothetical protein
MTTTARRSTLRGHRDRQALRGRAQRAPFARVGRALHPTYGSGPLDAAALGEVVSTIGDALASGAVDLEGALRAHGEDSGPDGGRAYTRLVDTPDLELWLIEWGPSTFLDLHDHGGAIGAIRMVRGNLLETFTDLTSRAPLGSRVLGVGDTVAIASDHVHEIWNGSGEIALSLHGYSPRLAKMTYYDHTPHAFLAPLRTEFTAEGPERASVA